MKPTKPVMPQAEVTHALFLDVPFMLAASRRRSYRESLLKWVQAVAIVFTERGFTTSDWNAQFRINPEAFRVRMGDLSSEGYAFGPSFDAWLGKISRWKTLSNLERYTLSLRAQIEKYRSASG